MKKLVMMMSSRNVGKSFSCTTELTRICYVLWRLNRSVADAEWAKSESRVAHYYDSTTSFRFRHILWERRA